MGERPDSTLAALARSGTDQAREAFAELVDRHLESAYDFALRVTLSEDAALEALQAALATAEFALAGFDPALDPALDFRGWLLGLVRPAALAAVGPADPADRAELATIAADQLPIGVDPAEAARLAPLVWDGATILDPQQRLMLDLATRQLLGTAAVARVVGVSEANGEVMVTRLYSTLGDQLGAYVLANDPTHDCVALANLARSAGGSTGDHGPTRETLQHVAGCTNCKRHWQAYPSLLDVYSALAPVTPSDALRSRIVGDLVAAWPGNLGRVSVVEAPLPPDRADSVTPRATRLMVLLGIAAALLAGALLAPFSPISLTRGDENPPANAATDADPTVALIAPPLPTPTATPTDSPTAVAARSPSPSPSPSPTASPTPSPTPAATPTPERTPSPTASATSSAGTTPSATASTCATPFQASTAILAVPAGGTTSISLINGSGCGTVGFVVTVAAGGSWLSASPNTGSVPPGGSIAIGFSVDASLVPPAERVYSAEVTVTGGPSQLALTVSTQRGGAAPVVVSAGALCAGASAAFTVVATDDVAVSSVSILFQNAAGAPRSIALTSSGGAWSGATTVAEVRGGSGFLAVAVDGASHTAIFPLTIPATCN